jgi:hypothetical protein
MGWSLANLNPPTRFAWVEDDKETNQWISVRLASEADNKNFFASVGVKEKVERVVNPKTRAMERMTYFDSSDEQRDLFNEAVWDFSIADWFLESDDKDEDGVPIPIPCTKENKIALMRGSPRFAAWVAKCLESLRGMLEGYEATESKN